MKTIFRTAAIAVLLITASCSSDDSNAEAEQRAEQAEEQAEQLESIPLDAGIITDNVIIAGGTKNEGALPTSNGAIALDVSETSKMAILNEGFEVSINSDAEVVGAYIQFKSNDGVAADSYYDINIATNSSGKSVKRNIGKRKRINSLTSKMDDVTLDIDFSSAIEPGTFCYEICVYDAVGNVSDLQEVCLTVESWGGSSKIVGEWNLFKEVDIFGGDSNTTLVGEYDCDEDEAFDCNNGNSFTAPYYCYITNSSSFTFNSDGTFEFTYDDVSKEFKDNESLESCEAIYNEDESTELTNGNWAYAEDTNELVLIMSRDVYTVNGEVETTIFQPGDGAIFAEVGIFLVDDVIRLGPEEESSENSYYQK